MRRELGGGKAGLMTVVCWGGVVALIGLTKPGKWWIEAAMLALLWWGGWWLTSWLLKSRWRGLVSATAGLTLLILHRLGALNWVSLGVWLVAGGLSILLIEKFN